MKMYVVRFPINLITSFVLYNNTFFIYKLLLVSRMTESIVVLDLYITDRISDLKYIL